MTPPDGSAAPVDAQATDTTRALHRNLVALTGRHILFGHQDDLAYGTGWWAEPDRSDVLEVTGAYPSVQGFDLGHVELGSATNLDGVDFGDMRRWVRQAHAMGALVTLSWHADDPVTRGSSWTSRPTVGHLLPGGSHAALFTTWLDRVADYLASLTDDAGRPVPVVFRPYHEHTGDWFWWGLGHTTVDEYVALWRLTVHHLRDVRGLHHLLWAFSPDRSRIPLDDLAGGLLLAYPGDDVVDVLGLDDYWDLGHEDNPASLDEQCAALTESLRVLGRLAAERGKLAALTEVGVVRQVDDPWTGHLLAALDADDDTRRILWALTWRNPHDGSEPPFVAAPGTPAADDLRAFARHPRIVLADEMPDLYAL